MQISNLQKQLIERDNKTLDLGEILQENTIMMKEVNDKLDKKIWT